MLARRNLSPQRLALYIGVIAVLWIIIGVVVYRNFLAKPKAPASTPSPLSQVSNININPPTTAPAAVPMILPKVLFRDPRFTGLKSFGEIPVEAKNVGKANPFERLSIP